MSTLMTATGKPEEEGPPYVQTCEASSCSVFPHSTCVNDQCKCFENYYDQDSCLRKILSVSICFKVLDYYFLSAKIPGCLIKTSGSYMSSGKPRGGGDLTTSPLYYCRAEGNPVYAVYVLSVHSKFGNGTE